MGNTLKHYWVRANAFNRSFRGRFQLSEEGLVSMPYSSSDAPKIISSTYRVLPSRSNLGAMRVQLRNAGRDITGFVGVMEHFGDVEVGGVK